MCGSINISTISINIHESTIKQMGLKSWRIDNCPMRYPLTYPLYQLTLTESLSSYGYRSLRLSSLYPNIRWREIHVGRLLHVRLQFEGRDIDVIQRYQFTNKKTAECRLTTGTQHPDCGRFVSILKHHGIATLQIIFPLSTSSIGVFIFSNIFIKQILETKVNPLTYPFISIIHTYRCIHTFSNISKKKWLGHGTLVVNLKNS